MKKTHDNTAMDRYCIDKACLRDAFDRAADSYDKVAVLQHEVGRRLLDRLTLIRLRPARILDIGAGTGRLSRALVRRYRGAQVVALDIAPAMLRMARRRIPTATRWLGPRRQAFVCGDAESLPFAAACADLVVSNLTLQWCNDLDRTLTGFRRVLRPGGLLMFTTFGPDTLKELRASWQAVDGFNHVNAFIDMHDIGDALLRAGFGEAVMDREDFTLTYAEVGDLMRDLKALGAHNVTAGRPRGLTGRGRLRRMTDHYEGYRRDGRLPATYEVIYGHCWVPDEPVQARRDDGSVTVPLGQLRHQGGQR